MVIVCNYALFMPLISILMAQILFGTFRRRRHAGCGTVCTFLAHRGSFLYTWVVFWISTILDYSECTLSNAWALHYFTHFGPWLIEALFRRIRPNSSMVGFELNFTLGFTNKENFILL